MPPVPPLQRLLHLLHAKDCDCRAPLYHRDPIKLPIIVIPLPLPVYLCPTRIHLGNPPESYPLQSELAQSHQVLHTQVFKEVLSGMELTKSAV